jgi:hypothetical protein
LMLRQDKLVRLSLESTCNSLGEARAYLSVHNMRVHLI